MKAMKLFLFVLLAALTFTAANSVADNPQSEPQSKNPAKAVAKDARLKVFDFENYAIGKLPEDWSQYATGKGSKTEWKIVDDGGNKVLAQLSMNNPNYHFNEAVYNGLAARNVELKVRMKGVEGRMDQGGGFVWRFTDKNNYYVVRANPLEDNVVLYKVKNGVRTDLPLVGKGRTYGVDVKPLGHGWNELRLTVRDSLFTVYLNGEKLFSVIDETFKNAGKIGLWTKADAVTYFDDFEIKVLDGE